MRKFFAIFTSLRAAYTNRTDPEGMQLLARTYWRVILSIAIVIAILSIGIGAVLLFQIMGSFTTKQASDAILPTTLNRAKIESVLTAFDARRKQFEMLPSSTSTYPDPSR